MSPHLVSVIVPTYNRADCLIRAVSSALEQTYQTLEVIIVDDGSTDATADLVRQRWSDDPRVRFVAQANAGPSAARNRALSLARGSHAAFLDSDDVWQPFKLAAQMACVHAYPQLALVHTDFDIHTAGHGVEPRQLRHLLSYYEHATAADIYPEAIALSDVWAELPADLKGTTVYLGDAYSHLMLGNLMMPSASLVSRDAHGEFTRFDENLRNEETYEYFLRVCRHGPIAFIDTPTYFYERGRKDHLWKDESAQPPATAHRLAMSHLDVLSIAYARDRQRYRLEPKWLDMTLAGAHKNVARTSARLGDRSAMIHHLNQSLRLHPGQKRAWLLRLLASFMPPEAVARRF